MTACDFFNSIRGRDADAIVTATKRSNEASLEASGKSSKLRTLRSFDGFLEIAIHL